MKNKVYIINTLLLSTAAMLLGNTLCATEKISVATVDKLPAESKRWIDGILANQREDGYFGPVCLKTAEGGAPDLWSHMLVLDVLHSYYEYSGDKRVPSFMLKYFRWQNSQSLKSYRVGWGALRWADNMAVIYWLYNMTGEEWLLELSRKIHENSVNYTTEIPNWHNVNLAQGIREPAESCAGGRLAGCHSGACWQRLLYDTHLRGLCAGPSCLALSGSCELGAFNACVEYV